MQYHLQNILTVSQGIPNKLNTLKDVDNCARRLDRFANLKNKDAYSTDQYIQRLQCEAYDPVLCYKGSIWSANLKCVLTFFCTTPSVEDDTGFGFAVDDLFVVIQTKFMREVMER